MCTKLGALDTPPRRMSYKLAPTYINCQRIH